MRIGLVIKIVRFMNLTILLIYFVKTRYSINIKFYNNSPANLRQKVN
jgi:hypothetical protein